MTASSPLLVLDTGSARMSLAVCDDDTHVVCRAEAPRSSEALIELLEQGLQEAGRELQEIRGIVALQGPGSFTGLRVGMAAAMALHSALNVPATAYPTLEALSHTCTYFPALCVVHALRDEWYSQPFTSPGVPSGEIRRSSGSEPLRSGLTLCGPQARQLAAQSPTFFFHVEEVLDIASAVARAALDDEIEWDASRLMDPLYVSEPATTPPRSHDASP